MGSKVAEDYLTRFEQVCDYLSKNSEMYPVINEGSELHKCILTKHNILYFKKTLDSIIILDIIDSRQNPEQNLIRFNHLPQPVC